MEHEVIPAGEIHAPHNWVVADEPERLALVVTEADLGNYCWQRAGETEWFLIGHTPAVWKQHIGPAGADGEGISIVGVLASSAALPAAGAPGDSYLVAGELWVWATGQAAFVNAGSIVGPAGPPGHPGQIRFTGNGSPPQLIVGAEPGDTYLDTSTGNIYTVT